MEMETIENQRREPRGRNGEVLKVWLGSLIDKQGVKEVSLALFSHPRIMYLYTELSTPLIAF